MRVYNLGNWVRKLVGKVLFKSRMCCYLFACVCACVCVQGTLCVKYHLLLFRTLRITLLCAGAFHSTNPLSANTASVAARTVLQPALNFLLLMLFSGCWGTGMGRQGKGRKVTSWKQPRGRGLIPHLESPEILWAILPWCMKQPSSRRSGLCC